MADLYELVLSADLPGALSDAEASELRWHLGLGPVPTEPTIVTDILTDILTDIAEPVIGDDGLPLPGEAGEPHPLLAERGPAWRIGGALLSAMAPREGGGWALTSRQEIHPDGFGPLEPLLAWLHARAVAFHCHLRFYEDDVFEPLAIADSGVRWP